MQPVPLRPALWISLLLVLWAFYGLTGRSVWWDSEAVVLGHIQTLSLAHPLPYGLAQLSHTLTAGSLSFADGTRIASGLLTLLTLLMTALAARALLGPAYTVAAALALMGAFGLMMRAHAHVPELALMAAYASLLYGIGLARHFPLPGGVLIGLAWLALLTSRGLFDTAAGIAIALIPLLAWRWRSANYLRACALAAGVAVGGGLITTLFFDTATLTAWWTQATTWPQTLLAPKSVLNRALWFAWPLWPLAVWVIWHEQRRLSRLDNLLPVFAAAAFLALLALWPSTERDNSLLPLLVPLALLTAYALEHLRRGPAQAFYWFGVLCFGFFAVVFWVYFAAIEWGVPLKLARHLAKLVPAYQPGSVTPFSIAIAATATLLWLVAIPFFKRATVRPILVWATGMALIWTLAISLYRPWVETGWGYGPLVNAIAQRIPANACLNAPVDAPLRNLLRIELGDRLKDGHTCRYQIMREGTPPAQAKLIWKGQRPRKKEAIYRLYRRDHAS
jgi:hypothetical protein